MKQIDTTSLLIDFLVTERFSYLNAVDIALALTCNMNMTYYSNNDSIDDIFDEILTKLVYLHQGPNWLFDIDEIALTDEIDSIIEQKLYFRYVQTEYYDKSIVYYTLHYSIFALIYYFNIFLRQEYTKDLLPLLP